MTVNSDLIKLASQKIQLRTMPEKLSTEDCNKSLSRS